VIQNILKWLITASIIGVGFFGVLFFLYQSKLGLVASAVSIAILLLSLFIQQFLIYLIMAGGALGLALLAFLTYQAVNP
jgi:hypothetical protein